MSSLLSVANLAVPQVPTLANPKNELVLFQDTDLLPGQHDAQIDPVELTKAVRLLRREYPALSMQEAFQMAKQILVTQDKGEVDLSAVGKKSLGADGYATENKQHANDKPMSLPLGLPATETEPLDDDDDDEEMSRDSEDDDDDDDDDMSDASDNDADDPVSPMSSKPMVVEPLESFVDKLNAELQSNPLRDHGANAALDAPTEQQQPGDAPADPEQVRTDAMRAWLKFVLVNPKQVNASDSYAEVMKCWFDGQVVCTDEEKKVFYSVLCGSERWIKQTASSISESIKDVFKEFLTRIIHAKRGKLQESKIALRRAKGKRAQTLQQEIKILEYDLDILTSMDKVIRSRTSVSQIVADFVGKIHDEDFESVVLDRKCQLLGFDNCVLDLNTGEARPHQKADYVSKSVGYDYLTEETYDDSIMTEVKEFLQKVYPVEEELKLVQKVFYYSMRGDAPHKMFVIMSDVSGGDNSKSTVKKLVKQALGNQYMYEPSKALVQVGKADLQTENVNSHQQGMVELDGKRVLWFEELDKNKKLNVSEIKEMAGGNCVKSGRLLGSSQVKTFTVSGKLIMNANESTVRGIPWDDQAFVSRMLLIYHRAKFYKEQADYDKNKHKPNVHKADVNIEKKFPVWAPYFVKWCMEAREDYLANGFDHIPQSCKQWKEELKEDNDEISAFYNERLSCYEPVTTEEAELKLLDKTKFLIGKDLHQVFKRSYPQSEFANNAPGFIKHLVNVMKEAMAQHAITDVYIERNRQKIGDEYKSCRHVFYCHRLT